MAEATEQGAKAEGSGRGPRSPNFPAISLPDALGKARVLYDRDKRNPVRVQTILQHLGFGEKLSGSSARVISALRQFGLVDESNDQYRVTDAAFRIFTLSEAAPERLTALQTCAKKPAIYRELLDRYADGLPSDAALRDALILRKFNPASVDTFIRVFKASIDFAKLTPGAYSGESGGDDQTDDDAPADFGVGDYVQWESQGVLQFEIPRRVTFVSPDGAFAMVEGSATGIPMDQLTKADPPVGVATILPPPSLLSQLPRPSAGVAREVFSLEEGEAVLQWPTSLNAEGVQDLEDWLALVIKKLKRLKAKQVVESV